MTEKKPDPAELRTTSERVGYIADLMVEGLWLRRKTAQKLAEIWRVTPARVRSLSAEAHRLVTADLTAQDKQDRRARYVCMLENWVALDVEQGDRKGALASLDLSARLMGLLVTHHEHRFRQEVREMLEIAGQVLPRDLYRKYLAALVAAGKGERVEQGVGSE